jgi:3-oxoacyl-[acyl-carrier protein] reductase
VWHVTFLETHVTNNNSNTVLDGQVAVVTGAGRGIGRAISEKLAELGAHVVLCGRSRKPLEETADSIAKNGTKKYSIVGCDVTSLADVEALAKEIESSLGRVDILVNNAGIGISGPLLQLDPKDWDEVMNTNLRGVYFCIRRLAPMMVKAQTGHIINISSLAGKNPVPNMAAYSASKWALNGFSYSLAEELRPQNIRVSVICPGSVHTDFSPHAGKNSEKMLQASDVAHAVGMIVTQAPQSFASEILLRPTQKP